jgi:hypothetical protein
VESTGAEWSGGIEAHAVEITVRFGSETSRETRGRRALGADGMLAEDSSVISEKFTRGF